MIHTILLGRVLPSGHSFPMDEEYFLDDGAESECMCGLCAVVIKDTNNMCVCGSVAYHVDCYGAKRHLDRGINSASDAGDLRQWRTQSPQEYKYKALELRMGTSGEGRGRRAAKEKEQVRSILQEVRTFSTMKKRQRVFLLGHRAFMQWYIREEGYSPEEAAEKWVLCLNNKSHYRAHELGELKLAVRGATVLEHSEGTEVSHRRNSKVDEASLGSFDGSSSAAVFDDFAGREAFSAAPCKVHGNACAPGRTSARARAAISPSERPAKKGRARSRSRSPQGSPSSFYRKSVRGRSPGRALLGQTPFALDS